MGQDHVELTAAGHASVWIEECGLLDTNDVSVAAVQAQKLYERSIHAYEMSSPVGCTSAVQQSNVTDAQTSGLSIIAPGSMHIAQQQQQASSIKHQAKAAATSIKHQARAANSAAHELCRRLQLMRLPSAAALLCRLRPPPPAAAAAAVPPPAAHPAAP